MGTGDTAVELSPFDLEALCIASATEDQLFGFDLPDAITSPNSLINITGSSTDAGDQVTSHRAYSSAKSSTFSSAEIPPLARSRIGYAITQLKLAPRMMVENNSTLWCHAMLYDEHMPRSLQDAHASCALYNARNDINTDFVARHIANRIDELISAPLPTEAIEIMARAHALMLYQVMLFFGSDVRCFSQAEVLVCRLVEVGNLLLDISAQQTDPINALLLYPSAAVRAAWKSFLFRETLRRTVLSLFQFVAFCHLLRGQSGPCTDGLSQGNRVTLSAHLWSASNAFGFAVAWNERPHFLVHNLDFTDVLKDAQPDDIDNFGKTMLVSLQGIDDVKGWFYMKGGTF
ncbi:hypothetical protein M3J09_005953 [Ascochyta lentis]